MPRYQYACTACGEELEVVQSFADEPLSECPTCSGRLRKIFSPVGVVFKGSGFYKTDSRGRTPARATTGDGGSDTGGKSEKAAAPVDGGASSPAASTSASETSGTSSAGPADRSPDRSTGGSSTAKSA